MVPLKSLKIIESIEPVLGYLDLPSKAKLSTQNTHVTLHCPWRGRSETARAGSKTFQAPQRDQPCFCRRCRSSNVFEAVVEDGLEC